MYKNFYVLFALTLFLSNCKYKIENENKLEPIEYLYHEWANNCIAFSIDEQNYWNKVIYLTISKTGLCKLKFHGQYLVLQGNTHISPSEMKYFYYQNDNTKLLFTFCENTKDTYHKGGAYDVIIKLSVRDKSYTFNGYAMIDSSCLNLSNKK